jgi:predicted nucleic acid-binding Zn ribbon protein
VQSFTDDALTVCEKCNGKLRKLFNSVGIVFKGSGFYRTDSRGGGSSTDNASAKSDGGQSAKSEATSSNGGSTNGSSSNGSSSSSSNGSTSTAPAAAAS